MIICQVTQIISHKLYHTNRDFETVSIQFQDAVREKKLTEKQQLIFFYNHIWF